MSQYDAGAGGFHPEQPAYPYPHASAQQPADTSTLAIGVFIVSCLHALCTAVAAVTSVALAREYAGGTNNYTAPITVLDAFNLSVLLTIPVLVAAWVISCVWLMKARRNTQILSPRLSHTRAAGWVWAGWIVPVVNFWFPFQVVRDIHDNSGLRYRGQRVGWWWTAWLVSLLADRALTIAINGQQTGDSAGTITVLAVVVIVSTMVALVFWGRILQDVVHAQARFDR